MLHTLYGWYGKRPVQIVLAIIAVLLFVTIYLTFFKSDAAVVLDEVKKSEVTVKSVKNINFENSFTSIGVVEAVSEAKLQAEAGGRITSVRTEIGQNVRAGNIIATIENASESASVLQAQGAYEAAIAGSASGEVSITSAQSNFESAGRSAITTLGDTYTSVDTLMRSSVDDYFTFQRNVATGLSLDGQGSAVKINAQRTALEPLLTSWANKKLATTPTQILADLKTVKASAIEISQFIEILSSLAQEQDIDTTYKQAAKDEDITNITSARIRISQVISQIEGAETALINAEKALEQARLAGAKGVLSASSAQIKIALGSLRSAQAQYEKTLVRTPISGVVNALYLKAGEYVSPEQPAAVIANNNGLQVTTSVSEEESALLSVGDTVSINGVKTGTITALGGAIDPATGKVTVKISVDDVSEISNGSTVTIAFTQSETAVSDTITIPLSSVKMTGSGPVAFEVVDGKLKSLPLTLGEISGNSVVIKTGLTLESQIVVDARGQKEGAGVNVNNN